ncbi:hypothetical protein EVAR_70879_1 [Eumeta japonica]|uniref:Uncharacterized protein n=1 Tax=Eumeta variegata TaxID=151549 RepID=A0A4C2ADR1_EUMVA|nr:hypothetical protein EVAR_70879_1 [Eumeta japonica]
MAKPTPELRMSRWIAFYISGEFAKWTHKLEVSRRGVQRWGPSGRRGSLSEREVRGGPAPGGPAGAPPGGGAGVEQEKRAPLQPQQQQPRVHHTLPGLCRFALDKCGAMPLRTFFKNLNSNLTPLDLAQNWCGSSTASSPTS